MCQDSCTDETPKPWQTPLTPLVAEQAPSPPPVQHQQLLQRQQQPRLPLALDQAAEQMLVLAQRQQLQQRQQQAPLVLDWAREHICAVDPCVLYDP